MMRLSICGLLDVFYTRCCVVINLFIANSMLNSMNDLIASIKKGDFSFGGDEWVNVSSEAKDLIQHLIVIDPKKRLVPSAALKHKWFIDVPTDLKALKPGKATLLIQKNLQKNKRKLTKSNMKVDNTQRMSFNVHMKTALEARDAINALRYENDNDASFTDSDPPSLEENIDD